MRFFLLLILGLWCVSNIGAKERFDGYKVYRVIPKNERQVEMLKYFSKINTHFDFWIPPSDPNKQVVVMIPPMYQGPFYYVMRNNGLEQEVLIEDFQKGIEDEIVSEYTSNMNWTSYHTLETIYDWMDDLAERYPETTSIISAGRSFQDRDIKGVKLSFNTGRTAVFIEGGAHSREWISPATTTYIINELVTSTNPELRKIAESFDWYIFPVINPDGFVYSHTSRNWRKTRTTYERCTGADPNRNFDFYWGGPGTSDFVCDDTYGGPRVWSEVETTLQAEIMTKIHESQRIDVFLSMHSFSQKLLIPYGNSTRPTNYDDLMAIGQRAIEALAVKYGTEYSVGNSADILYATTGTSMDWAMDKLNIPIVYVYELRDKGRFGILLPAEEILPNNEEVMDSLIAMFEEAERYGYFKLIDGDVFY